MKRGNMSGRAVNGAFSLLMFCGICYYAYHAIQGEYGLLALLRAESTVASLMAEKKEVVAERMAAANRTDRLNERFLDLDLLDERARIVLGYMRPDEAELQADR